MSIKLGDLEVTIDLNKITIKEFRSLFDKEQSDDEGDKILAKACGLNAEQVSNLPYPDYRRLSKAFFEAVKEPEKDPS
jgi:hypothetical protein